MASDNKFVGIFGNFGTGNFGNDASLDSMVLSLGRVAPADRIYCVCGNPEVVEANHNFPAVPVHFTGPNAASGPSPTTVQKIINKTLMWPHAIGHLRRLKALIIPGTGIFDDFQIGPFGWPYDLFCWFFLARLMGVTVIFASIGAGPADSAISRWFFKLVARFANYRSYRDIASKSFMTNIGFDASKDPIYPDLAFSLPAPATAPSTAGSLTVGVGVMTYYGWRKNSADSAAVYDGYVAKMVDYISWLMAQGHRVRILMGDHIDERAVRDILELLGMASVPCTKDAVVFTPAHTLNDVLQQMTDIDIAVATRFHNVVCALKMGKPTISIGYAPKNDVLLAEMGLEGFCQHIDRLDVEMLKSQTTQLLQNRAAFERKVRSVCAEFDAALREQEDLIGALISKRTA